MPVFFIQDGIKFPDIIHAGKPHPDREIPQAQTAQGAVLRLLAPSGGTIKRARSTQPVDRTFLTTRSIEYDAIVVAAAGVDTTAPGVVLAEAVAKPYTTELFAAVGLHRAWDRIH